MTTGDHPAARSLPGASRPARAAGAPAPRRRFGPAWPALGFLLPGLALIGLTFIYPVYSLIRMSVIQSLGDLSLYVGGDNYALVLTDPLFRTSVRNNLALMICVPAMIVIALALALLLFEQRRSAPLYRFFLFVPYIVSITVSGIAFSAMLTKYGAVNQLLGAVGLAVLQRDWLGDPKLALFSVGAVIIWRECVLGIVLFAARLLSLPTSRWKPPRLTARRAGGRTGTSRCRR